MILNGKVNAYNGGCGVCMVLCCVLRHLQWSAAHAGTVLCPSSERSPLHRGAPPLGFLVAALQGEARSELVGPVVSLSTCDSAFAKDGNNTLGEDCAVPPFYYFSLIDLLHSTEDEELFVMGTRMAYAPSETLAVSAWGQRHASAAPADLSDLQEDVVCALVDGSMHGGQMDVQCALQTGLSYSCSCLVRDTYTAN